MNQPLDMKNFNACGLARLFSRLCIGVFLVPVLVGLVTSPAAAAEWVAPVGNLARPVVTSGFDPPAKPWLAGHRGVDLAASVGEQVVAAGSGTVSYVGVIAGVPIVSIKHGELRTTYEPVVAVVSMGEAVSTGQVMGTVGLGGHCSGQCLHWGLLRGDEYLNPLSLLGLLPPVLKPLDSASTVSMVQQRNRSAASKQGAAEPKESAGPKRTAAPQQSPTAEQSADPKQPDNDGRSQPPQSKATTISLASALSAIAVGSVVGVGGGLTASEIYVRRYRRKHNLE